MPKSSKKNGRELRKVDTPPLTDILRIMIFVESTAETIHLRIPRTAVSDGPLAQFPRGLRLETAVAGSNLSDAAADAMAEEMKADWWERNQHRCIPPTGATEP